MYADLHRHLDGSLRPETLAAFARQDGVDVPGTLLFTAGMGLQEALACFAFTVGRLQDLDRLKRVAAEVCEDAEADDVDVLEIRFAPQLHGAPPEAVVDAVLEGISGRAGLILCGLYGEDPAVLERHVDLARSRPGVVGIDLAGGPVPGHTWSMSSYAGPFREARRIGLGRTVHAGEGRPADEIRQAILVLHAQRIGHGTTLLDDPTVLGLVLERGVVIEACPTSNVHTGVISRVAEHPMARWLDAGVQVCVNTDNTLLSDVTSSAEHARVLAIEGMSPDRVDAVRTVGRASAFAR